MKLIINTLIVLVLTATVAYGQSEDEDKKYEISEEQMAKYEELASEMAENFDTTFDITNEQRKEIYEIRLRGLIAQHKYMVQEDELRLKLRELYGKRLANFRTDTDEIREMTGAKQQSEEFRTALQREMKHLRMYDRERMAELKSQQRIEQRKKRRQEKLEEMEEAEED